MKKKRRGRKPLKPSEKKIQVSFYVEAKHIKRKGGMEKVKSTCIELIES